MNPYRLAATPSPIKLKPRDNLQVGMTVCDRWWPIRKGIITRQTNSTLYVEWCDGSTWLYDKAHEQFLQKIVDRR